MKTSFSKNMFPGNVDKLKPAGQDASSIRVLSIGKSFEEYFGILKFNQ